jgi:hypothetical protein
MLIDKQIQSYEFKVPVEEVCSNMEFNYAKNYLSPSTWKSDMSKIYTALSALHLTLGLASAALTFATFLY